MANSLYGITGNKYFTGYDPDLSEAITLMGQFSLKLLKKTVDVFLNKAMGTTNYEYVIAQDTDSAYISIQNVVDKFCVGKSQQETVDFLVKFVEDVLQPVINKAMTTHMSKLGVDDCKLFYKLECIGPSAIWTAPKKYAFDILYSEGIRYAEPKMKVMGIEIVRSSTPHAVRDHLKKCVKTMLSGTEQELQDYILEVRKSFFELGYSDISFPRGVNGLQKYSDPASIYQKGNGVATPIAVRAALLYNFHLKKLGIDGRYPPIGEGEKVKFTYLKKPNSIHENVIAFPSKLPKEFGLEKYIDYNEQFAKSFLAPLDKLLDAVKWKSEKQNDAFDDCW